MNSSLTRRELLHFVPAAVAAATVAPALSAQERDPAKAAGPTATSSTKFKLSLAAYSYRDLLGGKSPALTMFNFVDDCAKLQLDGTELTSYYFPNPVTPEYLRQLKAHCFKRGLDISGTAIGNEFGFPDGEARQKQLANTRQWIDSAEILGAPVIRIFAGHQQKGSSEQEAHRLMVSAMEECCEYAGQHGVFLALENHGGPTSTADGLLSFVNDVKSPWFGVNLDTGNFQSDDVYGDLARVAKHAVNVQVKVVINQKGKQEPTDFRKIADILRDSGYRGYVVLEYEEKDDPRTACAEYLERMRSIFS